MRGGALLLFILPNPTVPLSSGTRSMLCFLNQFFKWSHYMPMDPHSNSGFIACWQREQFHLSEAQFSVKWV